MNDLLIPQSSLRPGLAVEFEVEDGGRGLKASAVRFAEGQESPPLAAVRSSSGEDSMCDVLTVDEYLRDVTELLLETAPSLTGQQILQIRLAMEQFAKKHGWAEG